MNKYYPILPADIYVVLNKSILHEEYRKWITMLYQPIIGYTAVSLYFTLIDDLDKKEMMSDDLTHHHLMATMQLKLDDIVIARQKLEAIGLLKTYLKQDHVNSYAYLLYSPLSPSEFLNHPILNVVLYNNIGKKEYEKIVSYFKLPKTSLKDYQDITSSFTDVFTSVPGGIFHENDQIVQYEKNKLSLQSKMDFNLLISSIPKNMVHEKCFNEDIKELITNLSFTYDIDDLTMQGIVRSSLNEKGLIDKTELRKRCRNFYQFENSGKLPTLIYSKQPDYLKEPVGDKSNWAKMVYTFETVTPYDYLRSKYKGAEPTARDLKLVESLLVDQKLKPGVVNVLIAYVLKINQQKLNKNYVETIAGQWKRLNIETVEEAMKISEKEHKKIKKMMEKKSGIKQGVTKKEKLPDWFDRELSNETTTKDEEQEMDELLKKIAS